MMSSPTTPVPPQSRALREHPLFDEHTEDEVWDFLERIDSEAELKERLRESRKSRTPVPGHVDLVMMWRLKARVDAVGDGVANANERISRIEGMLQVLMERGGASKHLAIICKAVGEGIGRVVESIVSDTWVKRTLAFAVVLGVMGYFNFNYFNASKGDASLNIGTSEPGAIEEGEPEALENLGYTDDETR